MYRYSVQRTFLLSKNCQKIEAEKKHANVSAHENKNWKGKCKRTSDSQTRRQHKILSKWIFFFAHGEIKCFYPFGMAYEKRYANWIILKNGQKRFTCRLARIIDFDFYQMVLLFCCFSVLFTLLLQRHTFLLFSFVAFFLPSCPYFERFDSFLGTTREKAYRPDLTVDKIYI